PAGPALQAVSSCEALREAIQARLFAEVGARQEYARTWNGAMYGDYIFGEPQALPTGDATNSPPLAFSRLPPAGSAEAGGPARDLDVGDLVRLDGSRLYVLDSLA